MTPTYLAYFTCIFTCICTAAAGVLGQGNKCQIFTNDNRCPPGHELLPARCGRGRMECVPCREGYIQCDFTNTSFPVKCYRIACPEMEEGVTEARLTWNDDKTCAISCVCNEAKGYTGTTGFNCSLHKHPCGVDRELKKGSCVPCDKGYHNADPKFGRCVPDDSKKPSTQPSSSTWKSFLDSVTETSHPTQDIPTSQDDESSNHTVPIVVVVVIAVVAIIVVVVIGCIKSGKINIACCGWAIQDSNNSDRLPNGTNHCRHNAADGSCPNGTIGGQSNISTGHQHPNGGYQTATGGQPNGIVDGHSTDGHSTDAHSTDARTDGTISSNGGGTTWNYSLDARGTNGESGDPNTGTSSSSTSRQSPNCSQAEYSTRALTRDDQAPQHGQDIPRHDADTADVSSLMNLLGSSLSELTTRSTDVFDPEQTEQKMPLSSPDEDAAASFEANETNQPLLDSHNSQAFAELAINRY